MTREDIVKAASKIWGSEFWTEVQKDRLEKFATIVASSERETCVDLLMGLHQQQRDKHNYFHFAANKVKESVAT